MHQQTHQYKFQHTAARRRLGVRIPEADQRLCFNTQPPEGGWQIFLTAFAVLFPFQHTAARRRLATLRLPEPDPTRFQHTAARRRLVV